MATRDTPDIAPPALVERRLAELLALGFDAFDDLGRAAGRNPADARAQLEALAEHADSLAEVNHRLAPLMRAFQPPTGGNRWWRWFTGVQLEYEVQLADVCKKVAATVDGGQQSYRAVRDRLDGMARQYKLIGTEIDLLETDINALRLLGSPEYLTQRLTAGYGEREKARLATCLDSLERQASNAREIQAGYQAAVERAQPIADRYRELRTMLLPMWRRAVGFDLFARGSDTPTTTVMEQA